MNKYQSKLNLVKISSTMDFNLKVALLWIFIIDRYLQRVGRYHTVLFKIVRNKVCVLTFSEHRFRVKQIQFNIFQKYGRI